MKYLIFIIPLIFSCNYSKISICKTQNITGVEHLIKRSNYSEGRGYQDQRIVIEGLFAYNMEDIAVYSSKSKNAEGVWLVLNESFFERESDLFKLVGKHVNIYGKVDTLKKGHLNAYLYSIRDIQCIEEK